MGETRWTVEQKSAIEARNGNLLVAAAAGAGKTAVLVERIIQMLTDKQKPIDIDTLLIVTFTNAAATEMRERIAAAISKVLEEDPSSPTLHRQLTLLNKASITTIHSFCLEVIRSNFQKIDIDPGFRIADETEAVLLKLEVLQELFEDMYEDTDSNQVFLDLLECYSGNRDDQALQSMVLNLYDFIQSSPWTDRWLKEKTALFDIRQGQDLSATIWGNVLLTMAALELQGMKKMMESALECIELEPGLDKYFPVFQDEVSKLDTLLGLTLSETADRWDSLYAKLQSFHFDTLPRAAKDCDPEQRDYVKGIRDSVKKRLGDLSQKVIASDSAEVWVDLQTLYPLMRCLSGLVSDFSARYAARKSDKSIVDFNDLEHFCLEILSEQDDQGNIVPSKTALGYRTRFAEILVDEYQDSNDVQETIIKMISKADIGNPNVFMVGDVKQSIYRFRQANPELFQNKYQVYSDSEGQPYRKILLYKNFRSRKEVVDAVNFIFKQIMSKAVGELEYTDREALYPGADYPVPDDQAAITGGDVELHLLQSKVKEVENGSSGNGSGNGSGNRSGNGELSSLEYDSGAIISETDTNYVQDFDDESDSDQFKLEDAEMLDNMQCEARLIAKRIKELLQPDTDGKVFQVLDKETKKYRKAENRDIVILLRTTRNWSEVFTEELANQGIPAFADTGSGFFKTVEIQVILSLLQIIDNPLQDIPLLAVLRSPLVALTTDELAEVRLADRRSLLFDALKIMAETGDTPASEKARLFLEKLKRWREMSLYMTTDQLLWLLYQETGYYGTVGAMSAGQQRQANLRILFERARRFEETSFKGLFSFIYFVDKIKSSKGDMGSAKMLGEKDNVVRIMSIHKSKGLEFPVVILAGCGKKFNLQDLNKNILLHQGLGFGPDVVDYRRRISYPSIPKLAIREKIRMETMSEEMRILYVAMTRAKEKLIITGVVKDTQKALDKWARCSDAEGEKLPAHQMIKADNYLDWIGPALIRHKSSRILPELTACSGMIGSIIEDPSVWRIHTWLKSELLQSDPKEEQDEKDFLVWLNALLTGGKMSTHEQVDSKEYDQDNQDYQDNQDDQGDHEDFLSREIVRRLSWEYPFQKLTKLPAKVTVTELKRRFDNPADEGDFLPQTLPTLVKKPLFLEKKKGLSAAEVGSVMHFVMQHIDLTDNDIEGQVIHLVEKDLLTEEQAKCVKVEQIRAFTHSPLGRRMILAQDAYREVRFNMEIPCSEVYSDLNMENCEAEMLLLQGVIDCYFEESDGLVLIDYKTDYVPEGQEDIIKERYRFQIAYYARALEKLTGKRVKEKYIYSFYLNKAIAYEDIT